MVILTIIGFCEEEEKLFGPVQVYVAPTIVLAVKLSVCPEHTGELLPAVGAEGGGATITEVIPAGPRHPFTVAVTEYVPASTRVTLLMTGF